MNAQVPEVSLKGNHLDAEHDGFLSRVNTRFLTNIQSGNTKLFTTDVDDAWGLFLASFRDATVRQHHRCHRCRQFIERFGTLAMISESGQLASAIWHENDANEVYQPAVRVLAKAVTGAKVTGVYLSSADIWGTPHTGDWRHLSLTPPAGILHKSATRTAGQAMAEKGEDFKTVMHALGEYTRTHLETAIALLKTDSLYRSEKVLGQAEWLHELHVAREAADGNAKANTVWRAVASAPAGFCHPRSSMIGTLLEDIAAGMEFSVVAGRFAAKMHPLAYLRPQAAPPAGAIVAAEKVMQQLGAAGSLARRFARLDDLKALWKPAQKKESSTIQGLFDHLMPKGGESSNLSIPAQTMTWDKFQRTVLPTAERIEFRAPGIGRYSALVTAVNADSPPILQWDNEDARNPVSWYFWHEGSSAVSFSLVADTYVEVEAITLKPSMWNGGYEHHGVGVMFVLKGARETRISGAALFPEFLKSEFHGIRSVMEAYSRSASIEGIREPHAAGVMLTNGERSWDAKLRVWVGGRSQEYQLDRWD
jgi:hypothetical protein